MFARINITHLIGNLLVLACRQPIIRGGGGLASRMIRSLFMVSHHEKTQVIPTKNLIIDAAEQLFARFGYLGVSMSDIAESLEITKAALYYHFASKEDLYLEVLGKAFDEFLKTIENISRENLSADKKLQKVILAYVDFCAQRKGLAKMTLQDLTGENANVVKYINHMKSEVVGRIEPIVGEFLARRKKDFANTTVATNLFLATLNGFIAGEILGAGKNPKVKDIVKQINSLLFK